MIKENINLKALNDVYQNAQIAVNSIDAIYDKVKDATLKKELKTEREGYAKIVFDTENYIVSIGKNVSRVNAFKKTMMDFWIKLKASFNNSRNHIASMLINGTVMGINELTAMINEKKNLDDNVTAIVQKLLDLETTYQENLKSFL